MYLRVNADDLGLSARVNDEAFELISRGLVDSASVIANAPETEHAIRRAKQFPQCRFGLHLNVTQFKPLRADVAFAPVLKPDGSFTNVFWRVRKDNSLRRAIYQEWCSQVERCLELGLRPAHLDSHHDVHLLPELLPIVWLLQRKFDIRRVRRGPRIPTVTRQVRRAVRDTIWMAGCVMTGSELTDYRCGLHEFWTVIDRGAPITAHAGNRSLELVVHPGNDFDPVFHEETELLRAGWLGQFREADHAVNGAGAPKRYGRREMRWVIREQGSDLPAE